jgi:hypothetical protein
MIWPKLLPRCYKRRLSFLAKFSLDTFALRKESACKFTIAPWDKKAPSSLDSICVGHQPQSGKSDFSNEFLVVLESDCSTNFKHVMTGDETCFFLTIGSPLTVILICLALFLSVQKHRYDTLGNVLTISINHKLGSIHPIRKNDFDYFDWKICSTLLHHII